MHLIDHVLHRNALQRTMARQGLALLRALHLSCQASLQTCRQTCKASRRRIGLPSVKVHALGPSFQAASRLSCMSKPFANAFALTNSTSDVLPTKLRPAFQHLAHPVSCLTVSVFITLYFCDCQVGKCSGRVLLHCLHCLCLPSPRHAAHNQSTTLVVRCTATISDACSMQPAPACCTP